MIIFKGYRNGPANVDINGNVTTSRKMIFHYNAGESPIVILARPEIPLRGAAHPDNATLPLSTISIGEPQGDVKSGSYEVTLSYTRAQNGMSYKSAETYPWKLPPYDVSFSPAEYVVAFQKAYDITADTNGSPSIPVLNSAGDPFEESTTQTNGVLRFTYNLQDFNMDWILDYQGCLNSEAMNILDTPFPALRGKIKTLAASQQKQYTQSGSLRCKYWVVSAELEVSKKIMTKEIMQMGLFFKPGGSSSLKERIYKRIDGKTGVNFGKKADCGADPIPCDMPQRLTASGDLLDATGASTTVTTEYASFYDKMPVSWRPLNFPSSTISESSTFTYGAEGTANI